MPKLFSGGFLHGNETQIKAHTHDKSLEDRINGRCGQSAQAAVG
jgi:hypothetical protein